jgi:hypothetical protein
MNGMDARHFFICEQPFAEFLHRFRLETHAYSRKQSINSRKRIIKYVMLLQSCTMNAVRAHIVIPPISREMAMPSLKENVLH